MIAKLQRNKDIVATAFGNLLRHEGVDRDGVPFIGGVNDNTPFRTTQHEAIAAGEQFVLYDENGHKGYFEIATGIGKTVIFLSLIKESYFEALRRGIDDFNSIIVVPTTQLVGQTKESFEKYVPELKSKIGLYGDGHKDLGKPITVITYVAWQKLIEEGVLNYENTDLLISDEAHRGISERHVENFFDAFGDETVSFAFTATAEFDLSKSVELTHGTKIYEKHLGDGVRGNELAAYIQTQLHEIGIETPDLTDEFNEEAQRFNQDPNYRTALKRKAWNNFALEQFKHGKDDHTGDFLHENKAAFFVSDTTHADDLEALLNEDLQLQFIAKSRGLKGVSVAIHSNLPKPEQRRRMKDYLAGKYLAVVGADQFKEGFDYPELKTVFDYPRGSLVDKSQILGRGGRKWWNEAKDRWEGMTFIDTVIYFDEPDPEASERNRANALRYAVLASSIIDGSHILSEAEEKRQKDNLKKASGDSGFGPVYPDDIKVVSHTTLNQIKAIHAEIAHLNKEHWIEITQELRDLLNTEIQRTGFGAVLIAREMKSSITWGKLDINADTINTYIFSSRAKYADGIKFKAVCDFLSTLPSADYQYIDMTEEMRQALDAEIKRTSHTTTSISKALADRLELNVASNVIASWLKSAKKINTQSYTAVMNFLANEPNKEATKKLPLTDDIWEQLSKELSRTGIIVTDIANAIHTSKKANEPEIKAYEIKHWKARNVKLIDEQKYRMVINFLSSQKSASQIKIPLTEKMREELQSNKDRTGLIFRQIAQGVAELESDIGKIDHTLIHSWLNPKVKMVDEKKWIAVMAFLRNQPDAILKMQPASMKPPSLE